MKLVLLEKLNECGMKSGILFLQYLCLQLRIEYFVVVMIMSLPELYKKTKLLFQPFFSAFLITGCLFLS